VELGGESTWKTSANHHRAPDKEERLPRALGDAQQVYVHAGKMSVIGARVLDNSGQKVD
jgi:hypothetical protein